MRALPLILVALPLAALTACADPGPVSVAGEAGPAGSPSTRAGTVPVTPSVTPGSTPPSTPAAPSVTPSSSRPAAGKGPIRDTGWADVTLAGLWQYGKVTFKDGKAASGPDNCTMLPSGARPAYAEFLTEEPADSPVTEDALILIECGSDMQQQLLVPVKVGFNQKTREAIGFIRADAPKGPDNRMTFTSYTVQGETIVTTVRKTDGSKETRRYRFAGGTAWERTP
ncbi:MAG: hypothetical protein ABW046_22305 [Actinoplanes sp.]